MRSGNKECAHFETTGRLLHKALYTTILINQSFNHEMKRLFENATEQWQPLKNNEQSNSLNTTTLMGCERDKKVTDCLRNRRDWIVWCTHLGQNLVEPVERPIEMDLHPARCRGNVLAMILSAPTFHEAEAHCAHLGELEDSLIAALHGVGELACKVPVVEDTETASWRYLAHCRQMKTVMLVAVATLNEDT